MNYLKLRFFFPSAVKRRLFLWFIRFVTEHETEQIELSEASSSNTYIQIKPLHIFLQQWAIQFNGIFQQIFFFCPSKWIKNEAKKKGTCDTNVYERWSTLKRCWKMVQSEITGIEAAWMTRIILYILFVHTANLDLRNSLKYDLPSDLLRPTCIYGTSMTAKGEAKLLICQFNTRNEWFFQWHCNNFHPYYRI